MITCSQFIAHLASLSLTVRLRHRLPFPGQLIDACYYPFHSLRTSLIWMSLYTLTVLNIFRVHSLSSTAFSRLHGRLMASRRFPCHRPVATYNGGVIIFPEFLALLHKSTMYLCTCFPSEQLLSSAISCYARYRHSY